MVDLSRPIFCIVGTDESINVIGRGLVFLGRFAPQAMALGVFIGLLAPWLTDLMRPLLSSAVWLLLVLSLLRVDVDAVVAQLKRPILPVSTTLWMLIASPLIVAAILTFFDFRPGVEAGMILAAGSSALFSTPVLGVMFGLNGALLLVVLVASTLLVPISLPLIALFLLGFDMGADPFELLVRMSALVTSAVIAAFVFKNMMGRETLVKYAHIIDGWAVILLIIFAVAIMQGLQARIIDAPMDTLVVTGLSFATYVGLMILSGICFLCVGGKIGRQGLVSLGFISGTRNLAIILAVLPPNVDPDIPLFFAVGQFPIYIMPLVLRPVINRLLGKTKV
jgi:predicted Na+-dependent transporter